MATTSPAERLAREISDLRRRIAGLERSAAADLRSIDGGSFTAYDDDGTEVVLLGRQEDGSWGVQGVNGGQVVADSAREGAITAAAILDGAVGPEKASFYGEIQQAAADAAQARADADAAQTAASAAQTDAADAQAQADAAQAKALEALGVAEGKSEVVFQATAPTGDASVFWVDTDTGRGHRWDGTAWVEIQDTDVQAALTNASQAQDAADAAAADAAAAQSAASAAQSAAAAADAKAVAAQGTADDAAAAASAAQSAANSAQTAASNAQTAADNAEQEALNALGVANSKADIVYAATAPAGSAETYWVDTDTGKGYRWDGTSWVLIQDEEIQAALSQASSAQAAADSAAAAAAAAQSDANDAAAAALAAQGRADDAYALADGKVQTYFGSTDPTTVAGQTVGVGDLWFDAANGNVVKRWSGSSWAVLQDEDVQTALATANGAQAAVDGKITTFYGSTAPTAEALGDLWVDPARGNLVSRWDGTSWVALVVDSGAIAQGAITETEISDQAVSAPKLASNLVLSTRVIGGGSATGARVELNSTGLFAYDAGGVQTFGVDGATGVVDVTGDLRTAPSGRPRLELTDYTIGVESGEVGAAQIRLIPGENVVSGWDTLEPGFITLWSATSNANDGFHLEIVTPKPTNTFYKRARLRLQSGNTAYSNPQVTTYGELWVYDDFDSPLRLFSVTPAQCYIDSDEWYLNTRVTSSYARMTNAEFVWQSGGSDWLWVQNDALEFRVNNDLEQHNLAVYNDTVRLQSNDVFMGGSHRAAFTGGTIQAFAGYENVGGGNRHGWQALEGGTIRAISRSSAGMEIVNGSQDSYRPLKCSNVTQTSDRRAKTNFRDPESALAVVRNAPTYEYDYKAEFQDEEGLRVKRIGPMADDLPDHVASGGGEDDLYGGELAWMDLGQMIGVLWAAVQELDEELDEVRGSAKKPARKARDLTRDLPLPARKPVPKNTTPKEHHDRRPIDPRPDRTSGPGRRG